MSKQGWIAVSERLPPDGQVVLTKIDDSSGIRNEQPLKFSRSLWWLADGVMYVYYQPTHWRVPGDTHTGDMREGE